MRSMLNRQRLKSVVLLLAAVESAAVGIAAFVGVPLNQVLAAATLLLALLLSLRYFWQRLSGRDAQFGNLVVKANEPLEELDKFMFVGHAMAAVGAVGIVLA